MSKYETVLVERHGAVAVVSLNRPDKLNSFDGPLRRDLLLAVREVNDDDSVRVVILTGAGRAFSAGADLADMPEDKSTFRVEDQLNGEYKPALMEIHEAHQALDQRDQRRLRRYRQRLRHGLRPHRDGR